MKVMLTHVIPAPGAYGKFSLTLPPYTDVLSFGYQAPNLVVWTLEDTARTAHVAGGRGETRFFVLLNTGDPFEPDGEKMVFVGTTTTDNGVVWHLFELIDEPF